MPASGITDHNAPRLTPLPHARVPEPGILLRKKQQMKYYLSAPMRGRKFYNFPAFDDAKARLQALGHEVISPADCDRENGFDALLMTSADDDCMNPPPGFDVDACIRRDTDAVLASDGICILDPLYYRSTGCRGELAIAAWARKPVFRFFPGDADPVPFLGPALMPIETHLERQFEFSKKAFGPGGDRTAGLCDLISKELDEVMACRGQSVEEWIDIVILAADGALRAGFSPTEIVWAWQLKQAKNEARKWPDWRTAAPGKAIEHIRE